MTWQKGKSGNPKGRPPILLPEVQRLIERDRNAVKVAILSLLNLSEDEFQAKIEKRLPMIERILCQCIERIQTDGDVQKLKMLLEIPLGKLPEEREPFELSPEEKVIIQTYRERIEEQHGVRTLPDSSERD